MISLDCNYYSDFTITCYLYQFLLYSLVLFLGYIWLHVWPIEGVHCLQNEQEKRYKIINYFYSFILCVQVFCLHICLCAPCSCNTSGSLLYFMICWGEFFAWFLSEDGFYCVFISFFSFGGVVWCSFYCLGIEMVLHIAQVCFKLTL